ncbi:MAG TPA: RNA polymerase sigma factor [Gaiellaceae bacterium]|nr:RNA polymerase sigma factor [Gaiellaceae bacterium]
MEGVQEPTTFAAAAEAHLDDVYGYLVYLTGDRGLAEDLAAETFERALRQWPRFDPARGAARTWLCQVARSTALDHFRAERRRRGREDAYARRERQVDEGPLVPGLSPDLERALLSLSAADRELVALRVLLDLDGPTAARLLGISATACSTRLSRALTRLEERMRDAVPA